MPRSSEYLLEGYTYHLTQRCHNRKFLMRFARDRDAYREWLREGVERFQVPVYGYCLTSNHVHLVVHADSAEAVGDLMHLAAGATAKQYNLRKHHLGSLWEHPYQCTVIEDGHHLLNCLCYVDLNMVRAGVVSHPREWKWCGYDELTGSRQRYRLLAKSRLLESLGMCGFKDFDECYHDEVEKRLLARRYMRESHWTESLAVGSEGFVKRVRGNYATRRQVDVAQVTPGESGLWTIREAAPSYDVH